MIDPRYSNNERSSPDLQLAFATKNEHEVIYTKFPYRFLAEDRDILQTSFTKVELEAGDSIRLIDKIIDSTYRTPIIDELCKRQEYVRSGAIFALTKNGHIYVSFQDRSRKWLKLP